MVIGVVAALAAALCWTLASSLWRRMPTALDAAQLNLLKNVLALGFQLPALLLAGTVTDLRALPAATTLVMLMSGAMGIAIGDTCFFAALRRLGTRRTLTVDAAGPAVTAAAALVWLAEQPQPRQWLGIALISLSLLLVVLGQPASIPDHRGEQRLGIALALLALGSGVAGALLARSVLRAHGLDPLTAATLRLMGGTVLLAGWLPALAARLRRPPRPRPGRRRWPLVLLATLLGTTGGMVLQQLALSKLAGGLAVALLATSPVMALPLAKREGDCPGLVGGVAAVLCVTGVILVAVGT